MKVIGLIGGMSWESTVSYYRQINESIKAQLGGLHSAKLILYSVDFHEIERLQDAGDWVAAGELLAAAARSLQSAGADFLVLCTNTMHKVASAIEDAISIPLLHIAGQGHKLVENLDPFTERRAAIPHPQCFDQLLACCHADSPRHVVPLPPDHPTGSNLREATGQHR